MSRFIDLTGQTFNQLTVLAKANNYKSGNAKWHCVCTCGKSSIVGSYQLRNGLIKSCGCNSRTDAIADIQKDLAYNTDTGIFTWITTKQRHTAGAIAGHSDKAGYTVIIYAKQHHYAHRLVWLFVHGSFPKEHIDHINHDRADNRISNLREVSQSENAKNQRLSKSNKSGVIGVYFDKARNKWIAKIHHNNAVFYQRRFDSFQKAVAARKEYEALLGYHQNHGT